MYSAMGREMSGGLNAEVDARALEASNAGKFGRPYKYSDPKIAHLAALRDYTGAALRRVEGAGQLLYGMDGAPDHTTLCRRLNSMDLEIPPGAAVLCDYGRTLVMTVDSTGEGMTRTNGWRHEKHGGKSGCLSLHTVAHEKTGEIAASKMTAPEGGDAPRFTDLIESALRKQGIDPEKRREESRRRRADLAAGKAIVLSRSDGVADAGTGAAAKIAASVEKMIEDCK